MVIVQYHYSKRTLHRMLKNNERSFIMIITFGNFKGGIGKTTTTLLCGYILEKMYSKKVLLIDTDPQMNLTELAEMSYKKELDRDKNIFSASFDQLPTSEHIERLNRI